MNWAILFMAFICGMYALISESDLLGLLSTIFMTTALLALYIEYGEKND